MNSAGSVWEIGKIMARVQEGTFVSFLLWYQERWSIMCDVDSCFGGGWGWGWGGAGVIIIFSEFEFLSSSLLICVFFLSFPFLSFPFLSFPSLSFPLLSFPFLSSPSLSFPSSLFPRHSYYRCNRYSPDTEATGAKNDKSQAALAKLELDRYLHYYKRWVEKGADKKN